MFGALSRQVATSGTMCGHASTTPTVSIASSAVTIVTKPKQAAQDLTVTINGKHYVRTDHGLVLISGGKAKHTSANTDSTPTPTYTLSVAKVGLGMVTSVPAGISCGVACSGSFSSGTMVTLSAVADSGYTFWGWSGGGCSGTGTCTVTVSAATTVTATYLIDLHMDGGGGS